MLLEHEPVYTAGKRTSPSERPSAAAGAPVIDVDRGGKITWHGPGQVVGYPIVRLAEPVDVVAFVRQVEQVLIDVCAELGLDDRPDRGARPKRRLGRRRRAWTRSQGGRGRPPSRQRHDHARVRAQLRCDLAWFSRIVPCGIADAGVTSLSAELGRPVTVTETLPLVERHLPDLLAPPLAVASTGVGPGRLTR